MVVSSNPVLQSNQRVIKLMGNRFEVNVVHYDADWANKRIDEAIEEIKRIEKILTTYNEASETNQVNHYAGIKPVKVSEEMFQLTQRSLKISHLTQGAFDITYGGLDKDLWNFNKQMTSLPDRAMAKKGVKLINYKKVLLDPEKKTIFLKDKGMRIGFGGIGKGYAAERAKTVLQNAGVTSGIVNAAGDLTAWGHQPNGKPWTIGIADPNAKQHPFSYLNITGMAIATSGNYEKYVIIGGIKYSHTIDPKSGLPVTGIKSVTIIAPNAELADAMATPVMIMGVQVGLDLINQVKGLACIIIDDNNEVFTSNNVKTI